MSLQAHNQGGQHGFSLPRHTDFHLSDAVPDRVDVRVSQEQMVRGIRHSGGAIHVFSVLYGGILAVTEPDRFGEAMQTGIGHGKVMGLGLLSMAPVA